MDTRTASKPAATPDVSRGKLSVTLRRLITAGLGICMLIGLTWFLFRPTPVPVETALVEQGPMQVTINNQGQVRVHDKYVIAALTAANLERIELHEGDAVRRGQTLAILDPLPMDAKEREQAQARLESARALAKEASLRIKRAEADMQLAVSERARIERLVANKFISQQAADKARAAEAASRAEVAAARSREQAALADMKAAEAALISAGMPEGSVDRRLPLTTPVDGYVLKIH